MILVFEDDPGLQTVYRKALARLDSVEVFESPEQGWHLLEAASLIVTDLEMPGMTGFRLLQHLEHLPLSPPVVVVSGSLRLKEVEAQAWATLAKPFDLGELLELCGRLLHPPQAPEFHLSTATPVWDFDSGARVSEPGVAAL